MASIQRADDTPNVVQGHPQSKSGWNNKIGALAFQDIGDLLSQYVAEFFLGHGRPAEDALALHPEWGRDHRSSVGARFTIGLKQKRDIQHDQPHPSPGGAGKEATLFPAYKGMQDRFQPAECGLVAEDPGTEGRAINFAVLFDPWKFRLDAPDRGTAFCQQPVDGSIGVIDRNAEAVKHPRRFRFPHPDRTGQAKNEHFRFIR